MTTVIGLPWWVILTALMTLALSTIAVARLVAGK